MNPVREELEEMGFENKVTVWSPHGRKGVTQFSLTLEDDTDASLDIKDGDEVIKDTQIKSIWDRYMFSHICHEKTKEEIIWDEFRNIFVRETLFVIFAFLKDIHLFNPMHDDQFMNKPYQYMRAKKLGLIQPDTLISNDVKRVLKFFKESGEEREILYKQMDRIVLKDQAAFASIVTKEELEAALEEIKEVPNCWQEFCPKDVEYRTSCCDGVIYHTRIESLKHEHTKVDFRQGQDIPEIIHLDQPDEKVRDIVNKICKDFNLAGGVFDLIRDKEGNYWYLECNQTAQFLFHTRYTGANISRSIAKQLVEATIKTY